MAKKEPLTAETVVRYLVDRGLVAQRDLVRLGGSVEDISRRNLNFRFRSGGAGVVVKQSVTDPESLQLSHLAHEAEILRLLNSAPEFESFRSYVPQIHFFDPRRSILITDLIHPGTSLTKVHLNAGRFRLEAELGQIVARIMARFHNGGAAIAARGYKPRSAPMLPLALSSLVTSHPDPNKNAAFKLFKDLIRPSPMLAKAERLARNWNDALGLCHGDLRLDNFLVTSGESADGDLNVKLIDWEICWRGKPAWDVASILADYIRFWALSAQGQDRHSLADYREGQRFPIEQLKDLGAAFWQTYRETRQLDEDDAAQLYKDVAAMLPISVYAHAWEMISNQSNHGPVTEAPILSNVEIELAKDLETNATKRLEEWFGIHGQED